MKPAHQCNCCAMGFACATALLWARKAACGKPLCCTLSAVAAHAFGCTKNKIKLSDTFTAPVSHNRRKLQFDCLEYMDGGGTASIYVSVPPGLCCVHEACVTLLLWCSSTHARFWFRVCLYESTENRTYPCHDMIPGASTKYDQQARRLRHIFISCDTNRCLSYCADNSVVSYFKCMKPVHQCCYAVGTKACACV